MTGMSLVKCTAVRGMGLAVVLAVLLVSPASAYGPGPDWDTHWRGDGTTDPVPGSHGRGATWVGNANYTPYAGNTDGDDQGFVFDGSSHLVADDLAAGNLSDHDFIINFNIRTTDAGAAVMSVRPNCGGGPFWEIHLVDGVITWRGYTAATVRTAVTSPARIDDGASHNVAVIRTGTQVELRVDEVTVDTAAVAGDGSFVTKAIDLKVGGGHPCDLPGDNHEQSRDLIGDIDQVYIRQGTDPEGQDLSLAQESTPSVAAGQSGQMVVHRDNGSESWTHDAEAWFDPPAGVTFTGVSDVDSTCTLTDGRVHCPPTGYGPGRSPALTISFTVDESATSGTTVDVIGTFVNHENADPDPSNNTGVALPITIAPDAGVPLIDPIVGAPVLAGLGLLVLGRRRGRSARRG